MYMNRFGEWGGTYSNDSWGMMSAGFGGYEWVLWALAVAVPLLIIFVAWSLIWKGLALWHAARRGQYGWFIILLVVNTLGILEIIYLFFVAKLTFKELFSKHDHRV